MIAIQNTLVSEDLLEKKFVCDLNACKGQCCVAGDSGAPLEKEEISILERIFEEVKPNMTKEGIQAIEQHGFFIVDSDGDDTLPLVDGSKQCAFAVIENGMAKCSIEKTFASGKINFKKPISCHLYPVRITKYDGYEAVNYHEWSVCQPACVCGSKMDVPVYRFLRTPLVRKYGEAWYEQMSAAEQMQKG